MLGEKIARLRKTRKLSQYELAEKLGFSRGKLANYEQGSRQPDYDTLKKIADFFEVTTDYLLGRSEESVQTVNKVVVANKEISLSEKEFKIFEELKKYPILFHDLASNPEAKVKELIKLQKAKKLFLEEEDEEYGDGFGELED